MIIGVVDRMKDHKIFFIIGCGRSGTHYLAKIINTSEDVFVTVEEPDIFWCVVDHVLLPKKSLKPAIKRYKHHLKRHPIYADKSHPNLFNTEELLSEFPQAKFIGIYRDVYETIASMLVQKRCADWGANYKKYKFPNEFLGLDTDNLERYEAASLAGRCAFRWYGHYTKLMQLKKQLKDKMLLIDYADLIEHNESETRRLGEFMNVSFGCVPPDKTCRDKWKTNLSTEQQQEIRDVLHYCGMEIGKDSGYPAQ